MEGFFMNSAIQNAIARIWDGYSAPAGIPAESAASLRCGTVTGLISLPPEFAAARVYVGVFQLPIIQRRPPSWSILAVGNGEPAAYCLHRVAPGDWFVWAVATADSRDPEPWTCRALLVGGQGPVTLRPNATAMIDITLRPKRRTDLPILSGRRACPRAGCRATRGRSWRRNTPVLTSLHA
jgi:hypothetical protein